GTRTALMVPSTIKLSWISCQIKKLTMVVIESVINTAPITESNMICQICRVTKRDLILSFMIFLKSLYTARQNKLPHHDISGQSSYRHLPEIQGISAEQLFFS